MDVLSVEAYSYCLAMTKRVCKATHTDAMELKICDVEVNDLCVRSELSRPKSGVFDSRSSNPP